MLVVFQSSADLEKGDGESEKREGGGRARGRAQMSRENLSTCEVEIQTCLTVYISALLVLFRALAFHQATLRPMNIASVHSLL